ncbi:MAG: DUF1836 domain-containing protein [Lachnospiraceae bacterium]|nr:DUF1836 domain-containing protein [Lachnospiraceae bacterium]
MTEQTRVLFEKLCEEIFSLSIIDPDAIPNIDIYMDQLTTFMDRKLRAHTRNPERDKVLTKTMINNYTKNDLLPAPVRKKYTREHLILLIYIFFFKNNLSITDINTLIGPLKEHFDGTDGVTLDDIYKETLAWCAGEKDAVRKDMERMALDASKTFAGAMQKDRERLQSFAFLAMLEYDVYIKQTLIEKMLDRDPAFSVAGKRTEKKADRKAAKKERKKADQK